MSPLTHYAHIRPSTYLQDLACLVHICLAYMPVGMPIPMPTGSRMSRTYMPIGMTTAHAYRISHLRPWHIATDRTGWCRCTGLPCAPIAHTHSKSFCRCTSILCAPIAHTHSTRSCGCTSIPCVPMHVLNCSFTYPHEDRRMCCLRRPLYFVYYTLYVLSNDILNPGHFHSDILCYKH